MAAQDETTFLRLHARAGYLDKSAAAALMCPCFAVQYAQYVAGCAGALCAHPQAADHTSDCSHNADSKP